MMDNNTLKTDDINSTEKLLNLVRGKSDEMLNRKEEASPRTDSPVNKVKQPLFKNTSDFKKSSISVGVDIGHQHLQLVKAAKAEGKWRILEHRSIGIPPGVEKETDAFVDFLRAELVPFCGDEKTDIWAVMSSARVEVRQIRIPIVPESQLEQVVYWTLKKEASFDDKEYFFDYESLGEYNEAAGRKQGLICYSAPIEQVEKIKKLFSKAGLTLTGISIVAFFMQSIFKSRWVLPEKTMACLFIGNEYSRIDLFVDGRLVQTRDIKTGINSMIEMTAEFLQTRQGEGSLPDNEKARKILFALGREGGDKLVLDDGYTVGREEVELLVAPVLERFVRQMEMTFEHFTTNLGYERIGHVSLSSVMPVSRAMAGYFAEHLGVESTILDPIGASMSEEGLEARVALIPAFGAALSSNAYTPNLIFTFKEKIKKVAVERLNRRILAALLAVVFVCSGIYANQLVSASRQRAELARLEQQLQSKHPLLNRDILMSEVARKKGQRQNMKEFADRYAGMAVLSELSTLAPHSLSLTSVKYAFSERAAKNAGAVTGSKGASAGTVEIEGTVSGERSTLDTAFASYVMKLNTSPLFREVTVAKRTAGTNGQGAALTFTINAKVGSGK